MYVCIFLYLFLFLSPNRSRQIAIHQAPGSVQGFGQLKGSFSVNYSVV